MTSKLASLAIGGAVLMAAQHAPRIAVSTDQRITTTQARLKETPAEVGLLNDLAGAYLQKMRETADGGYLERADQIVARILAADPTNFEARRRQTEIQMQRHNFRKVVALATDLTRDRANNAAVWGMLGDACMEMGDYDRAADAYQTIVDLRPDLASYNRVAFYWFVTGDAEGAIDIMRRAIRSGSAEPENLAWCLADLGRMLLKTGVQDEAEQAFRQALATFPRYYPAMAGLGRVHAARGEFADAIRLLLAAQAKAPFPEYAGLLAKLYRKTGKADLERRQIALLDVADKLNRAAGETANRNLSLAMSDLGHHPDRALELAQAELKVRQDVYTYDALAWALFQNGKLEEAGAGIERALQQNSPEPSFHDHAARIFEAKGQTEKAKLHREKARVDYW
jgi:tetratricopeptide (TPR) repeat protein